MGYKLKKRQYLVKFEGTDYDGLEVTMGSMSVGELLNFQEKKDVNVQEEIVNLLAAHIKGWNITDDDDQPVPANRDELLSLDADLVNGIANRWTAAMSGVSDPLATDSTSGAQSPEASIPMETK